MTTEDRLTTIDSWKGEWLYAIVIDRFHDGKDRVFSDVDLNSGFGSFEELRSTCGGNINGIRRKLNYIRQLGCTSILLSPFQENNPEHYHGYAIQNFLNVDPRFGTHEELIALVREAHELGLRVIMDVVLNHTGNNWSYQEIRTPYRKRKAYSFSHWRYEDKPVPLCFRNVDWYSKRGHISRWDNYPESWDGDIFELKDLVWDNTAIGWQVLDSMVNVYTYWIKETGVDGFRLDALKHIRPEMANAFCNRIKSEARHLGKPDFLLIGEVVGDNSLISKYSELDAYFDFPFYFDFLQGIKTGNVYDVFLDKKATDHLPVVYLDNHDQIGMEPKKRIGNLLTEEQLLACLFLMGLQESIHCLYYGTEQGLKTKGNFDHDVRECLFDLNGSLELANPSSRMYRKISNTIHLVKEVKAVTDNLKKQSVEPYINLLCCQDDKLKYQVVCNSSALACQLAPELAHQSLIYSNYLSEEAGQLRAYELRVYQLI